MSGKIRIITKLPDEKCGHYDLISKNALQKLIEDPRIDVKTLSLTSKRAYLISSKNDEFGGSDENFKIYSSDAGQIVGAAFVCGINNCGLTDVPYSLPVWKYILRRWGNEVDED